MEAERSGEGSAPNGSGSRNLGNDAGSKGANGSSAAAAGAGDSATKAGAQCQGSNQPQARSPRAACLVVYRGRFRTTLGCRCVSFAGNCANCSGLPGKGGWGIKGIAAVRTFGFGWVVR